jgi:hypothetical protein
VRRDNGGSDSEDIDACATSIVPRGATASFLISSSYAIVSLAVTMQLLTWNHTPTCTGEQQYGGRPRWSRLPPLLSTPPTPIG